MILNENELRLTERLHKHTESVEKIEKWLGRGLCPWRDSEETEINYAEAFEWFITGPASPGVRYGRQGPLTGGVNRWLCKAWTPPVRGTGLLACLQERASWNHMVLTGFLQLPSPWLSLNWADAPAPLVPHPTPHGWGQNHAVRPWAGSHLRCSLSRVGTATVGA